MSLIIDALRKAQQLRLKEFHGVPFFKSQRPPDEKSPTGTKRRQLLLGLGLFVPLFILWMIVWNPFSSFREGKPTPRVAPPEKEKPSILEAEKKPGEPVKAPTSSQQEKPAMLISERSEAKEEEPLLKQTEEVKKPKISKPIRKTIISKSLSALKKASPQPLETQPPPKEEASLSARDETGKALQSVASSPEIVTLFNQGVFYQNQREMAKAVQAYQKVIELDPAYFEAYNNLGILYQEMGDFDRAAQAYQRSIEINPRYVKALNNLGILFYLKDRHEEALVSFQKAISLQPNNIESHLNLGVLFKKQGQWDKAMDSFRNALILNPSQGETHYNMALLYEQLNQLELAMDHYQKFIQLSSKTYPVLVSKVQRHLDSLFKMKKEKGK